MLMTPDEIAASCSDDGEFSMAARHWTGGVRFRSDGTVSGYSLVDGTLSAEVPVDGPGVVTLDGEGDVWEVVTMAVPPRFFNDISAVVSAGVVRRGGDEMTWWQYFPAIQRSIELMRRARAEPEAQPMDPSTHAFGAPIGRYLHLDLGGHQHRIYYEEAGQGIPILLQHTAGSHGVQWRHLLECGDITDRFRLIAYDLPFHGKSVPPTGRAWWTEQYRLEGEFLRSIPLAIADALELDRPVFMGCSVGGLLALDLALHHPDRFRSVISLEGALHIGGDRDRLTGFWHPQVSDETKARMMEGLTSPTSPIAYRKETIQTYAAGWPQLFTGDLFYYMVDYDLRDRAGEIDTDRVGVHILSGEYDYSGSVEHGREAHESIAGSTFAEMSGVGHFPMSENPEAFIPYLLSVLDRVAEGSAMAASS